MNTLEWFSAPLKPMLGIGSMLVPNDAFPKTDERVSYRIFFPSIHESLDDAPPMPTDQKYVLLVARHKDKFAYYWVPDSVLDDAETDIWAIMSPSLCEQLGISSRALAMG